MLVIVLVIVFVQVVVLVIVFVLVVVVLLVVVVVLLVVLVVVVVLGAGCSGFALIKAIMAPFLHYGLSLGMFDYTASIKPIVHSDLAL